MAMRATTLFILTAIVAMAHAQDADEERRLESGEVLVTTEEVAGRSVPRVRARALVQAPPEKVWSIIADVARYKDWMPRILESEELSREGDEIVVRLRFDMPFPFGDLSSVTAAVYTVEPGRLYKRTWRLRGGDFLENTGSWTLEPHGDGRATHVTYEILSEPNVPLPSFILESAQRTTLPELFTRLRARVE
jgi:uncharacterized protein YndB with AHSA1/START domain